MQAHSRPLVQAVQVMASVIEHFEALQLPHEEAHEEAQDNAADLSLARVLWNSLSGDLFSAHTDVSAAELDEASGRSGVLHYINLCIQLSEFVDGFQHIIQRCVSYAAAQLAWLSMHAVAIQSFSGRVVINQLSSYC